MRYESMAACGAAHAIPFTTASVVHLFQSVTLRPELRSFSSAELQHLGKLHDEIRRLITLGRRPRGTHHLKRCGHTQLEHRLAERFLAHLMPHFGSRRPTSFP